MNFYEGIKQTNEQIYLIEHVSNFFILFLLMSEAHLHLLPKLADVRTIVHTLNQIALSVLTKIFVCFRTGTGRLTMKSLST
jgi:hypothetical protein